MYACNFQIMYEGAVLKQNPAGMWIWIFVKEGERRKWKLQLQ